MGFFKLIMNCIAYLEFVKPQVVSSRPSHKMRPLVTLVAVASAAMLPGERDLSDCTCEQYQAEFDKAPNGPERKAIFEAPCRDQGQDDPIEEEMTFPECICMCCRSPVAAGIHQCEHA